MVETAISNRAEDKRKPRVRRQAPHERRQDLLQVTIACLARLGPRGTTGREICRQAGVSHGLLRHYFDNPDNLLLETYQQLCDQLLERFEAQLETPYDDPWESLSRFFEVMFADEWASTDVLGAWMSFWTLVRSDEDFAQVSRSFNTRLQAMMKRTADRLPHRDMHMPMDDAVSVLTAVMDGLWLDFCLAPERTSPERATALCNKTARQIFGL